MVEKWGASLAPSYEFDTKGCLLWMTCHSGWGESQMMDDGGHHVQCSHKTFQVTLKHHETSNKSQWHNTGYDGLHLKPTIWYDYTDVRDHLSKMSYVWTCCYNEVWQIWTLSVQCRCWKFLCLEGSRVFHLLVNHPHFFTWRLCLSCHLVETRCWKTEFDPGSNQTRNPRRQTSTQI